MPDANRYDVTDWPEGDPREDVGAVITSILADVRRRQAGADRRRGGRPGAVIAIPPGDFRLATQVRIDLSFLRIEGSGHGFTSSSIRHNTPPGELASWHELWPGGSRILVDLPARPGEDDPAGAAFLVARAGAPRISSVEFADFCIDGLHFRDDPAAPGDPENSYLNGLTGIRFDSAHDSCRVTGMGLVYLEHGLVAREADALAVESNFVAECGHCIELRGMGQASRIANNLIGAGWRGHSILAENHGGLLVSGNNVFPRGASSLRFRGVARSSVTGNRFHSFYPGMLQLDAACAENLIASNHFLRDREPWAPMAGYDNGLDDRFGLLCVDGVANSVIANHVSLSLDAAAVRPPGATPVVIRLGEGRGTYVASNHVVATTGAPAEAPGGECFATQVGALLATRGRGALAVTTVLVEPGSAGHTVLDSGRAGEVVMDRDANAFRPTPEPPTPPGDGATEAAGAAPAARAPA